MQRNRIVAKPAVKDVKPGSPPFPRAVKYGSARNVKNPGQLALKLTTPPWFSRPLNQPLNIHSDRLRRSIYRKSFMSCNWCSRNSPFPPPPPPSFYYPVNNLEKTWERLGSWRNPSRISSMIVVPCNVTLSQFEQILETRNVYTKIRDR